MIDHEAMKKQPQLEIVVIHHDADGLYTKEMHIPAGVAVGKHRHSFSHLSVLVQGVVRLICNDEEKVIKAPAVINITANVWHTIRAIEDSVWLCIHNTDRAEIETLL